MKRGDWFVHCDNIAKIMAVADGYAMARLPGCAPFVVFLKDIPGLAADKKLPHRPRHLMINGRVSIC